MFCKYCGKETPEEVNFCKYCGKSLTDETSSAKEVVEKKYSAFWIRFGAYLIDWLFIVIALLTLSFLTPPSFYWFSLLIEEEGIFLIVIFSVVIIYHILFLSTYSSTPGKMLYGLDVVEHRTRKKITSGKAIIRSLSYIISSFVFLLGFLWIAIDRKKHQGWHDKIAKTVVISNKKKRLVFPIALSMITFALFAYQTIKPHQYQDFYSYLGKDSEIMYLIEEKIKSQPDDLCCSYIDDDEFSEYLPKIPSAPSAEDEKSANEIYEDLKNAVVVIGTEMGVGGSGFIISPSGLIVTNEHIIEGAEKIVVAVENEGIEVFDVKHILVKNPQKDLAVLKIDAEDLPYAYMGDSELASPGKGVYAIGNPEGYVKTISSGIISQVREFYEVKHFQITTPISGGSSGGPLINQKGEIIGITTMFHIYGQNLNFAIPINYVKELLEQ